MPYYPTILPPMDSHESCVENTIAVQDASEAFWNGDPWLIFLTYALVPAVSILLVAGYADAIRDGARTYLRWLLHGRRKVEDSDS
jgi:hypothetical protein